jgi:superfamily I DNA and/or RNA helicase
LIRGKQVIVLWDEKQFSNVKSNNASLVTNQEYKSKIETVFRTDRNLIEDDKWMIWKIKDNFDIKNSILKFSRFIRNYQCQLKKHFRCYPEIISYSNKMFYDDTLQCMKIRWVQIDEVIKFDVIEHDGKNDATKNTNELEANFIIQKLLEIRAEGSKKSIWIISPHREQVTMILEKVYNLQERDTLEKENKLWIWTFDTCQWEERDIIFYSMVATKDKDRLMWIFPKDFSLVKDEVDW